MATSLLALLDDITTVLDDVAVLTKVAAKKTAGVLGDDLALNAQQVAGVESNRELPVVWAVARGSFVNKAILVPAALLISALAPWLITSGRMARRLGTKPGAIFVSSARSRASRRAGCSGKTSRASSSKTTGAPASPSVSR